MSNWYFISDGHLYVYYEDGELKYSHNINYFYIDNYLFNIEVIDKLEYPNLYIDVLDNSYEEVPMFKLICKHNQNNVILGKEDQNSICWIFVNYFDWFNNNEQYSLTKDSIYNVGNLLYINKKTNKLMSLNFINKHVNLNDGYINSKIKFIYADNFNLDLQKTNIRLTGENADKIDISNNIIYINSTNIEYIDNNIKITTQNNI